MNVLKLTCGTVEGASTLSVSSTGSQLWYGRGMNLHRILGPAVIIANGQEYWFRDGDVYTPTAHEKMMWELRKKNETV